MKFFAKLVLTLILFLYLAILTKLILFKYIPISAIMDPHNFTYNENFWRSNNFVPFKTIYFYLFLADLNLYIRIENLAGNIIGFMPFGFILPLLSVRFLKLRSIILATFTLSLTFEILQLRYELGSFDVDDLILNTLGGVLGFIPVKLVQFFIPSKKKRYKKTA